MHESSFKRFLGISILIILIVVGIQFKRMVIDSNFVIYSHTSCDPELESCFVLDCEMTEFDCDKTPYKKIEKLARNAPDCDLSKSECLNMSCESGEVGCFVTACSEETIEEGEVCHFVTNFHTPSQ